MSDILNEMFSPKVIAVIGASESPQKVGAIALKNIIESGYSGKVFPVNPHASSIGDLKCFPNVASLPESSDLAVIAIPAGLVINELKECGESGIKNIVIFSAGFREIGGEGERLEKELIEVANKYQLNILGPNCLGFASTNPPLNVTFGQVIKNTGNLKFISQSGAIATSIFDWCTLKNIGFDKCVTIGNKSVVNENDILKYWSTQKLNNSPIGLYLESIVFGEEFVKIIGQITPHNPVFILKPGKTVYAVTAMKSHTGAIAGEDRMFEAMVAETGMIRCQELGDFFDLAEAFAWKNAPNGPNVVVISNAGGPAVMATDTISSMGLKAIKNPIDLLGDALADRFEKTLEIVLNEKDVQSVIVILTPQLMTEIDKTAEIIGKMSAKYSQPIVCSFIGGSKIAEGKKILDSFKIPNYPFPERAIKVIASMWQWKKWSQNQLVENSTKNILQNQPEIANILNEATNANQKTLDNAQADKLMSLLDIATPVAKIISSVDEAINFGREFGYPIVMKMSAPGLLHKSDIGGVITNIRTSVEATNAFDRLSKNTEVKIQVQKQIENGIEVILGIKRDVNFGMVFLFGAGGKYAEILDDVNLKLAPLSKDSAMGLVEKSRVYKMLGGYRDDPAYKLDKLYEMMVNLGQVMVDFPEFAEIEINPVIITHENIWAVDPKVMVKEI
jgi:acetyltransferase